MIQRVELKRAEIVTQSSFYMHKGPNYLIRVRIVIYEAQVLKISWLKKYLLKDFSIGPKLFGVENLLKDFNILKDYPLKDFKLPCTWYL